MLKLWSWVFLIMKKMDEHPNATGRMCPRDGKQNAPWKGEEPLQGAWRPRVWAVLTEEKPSWGLIRTLVPVHCAQVPSGLNQIQSWAGRLARGSRVLTCHPVTLQDCFQAVFLTAGLAPWKDLGRVCHLQRVNLIVQWFSVTYTVSDTAWSI